MQKISFIDMIKHSGLSGIIPYSIRSSEKYSYVDKPVAFDFSMLDKAGDGELEELDHETKGRMLKVRSNLTSCMEHSTSFRLSNWHSWSC
jgi:hypothetical protein